VPVILTKTSMARPRPGHFLKDNFFWPGVDCYQLNSWTNKCVPTAPAQI